MAKSPWKLLTRFLSRGKAADQQDAGQAGLTEVANESEESGTTSTAVEASIRSESEPEPKPSAGSQGGKVDAGDSQERPPSRPANEPDISQATSALATDRAVLVIGAERQNPQDRFQPATRRKGKAQTPARRIDVERATVLAEQAAPNEPDPIRSLDKEIQELRSQLVVKLRLQNDQLRHMLRRFEPK